MSFSCPSVSGNRKFVNVGVLESGSFLDRNGEFQIELSLSRARSVFEHRFRVSQSIFGGGVSSACSKMAKFETAYFSYGAHDWSLALYPTGRSDSQLGEAQGGGGEGGEIAESPTNIASARLDNPTSGAGVRI